jgi:hypothetical protein
MRRAPIEVSLGSSEYRRSPIPSQSGVPEPLFRYEFPNFLQSMNGVQGQTARSVGRKIQKKVGVTTFATAVSLGNDDKMRIHTDSIRRVPAGFA